MRIREAVSINEGWKWKAKRAERGGGAFVFFRVRVGV